MSQFSGLIIWFRLTIFMMNIFDMILKCFRIHHNFWTNWTWKLFWSTFNELQISQKPEKTGLRILKETRHFLEFSPEWTASLWFLSLWLVVYAFSQPGWSHLKCLGFTRRSSARAHSAILNTESISVILRQVCGIKIFESNKHVSFGLWGSWNYVGWMTHLTKHVIFPQTYLRWVIQNESEIWVILT